MDQFLGYDMQKDTVLSAIASVMLNPDGRNVPVTIGSDQGSDDQRTAIRSRRISGYRAD